MSNSLDDPIKTGKELDYSIGSKPFFVLAPMDDVTDSVFRQLISSVSAPDLAYTEFVNVDGLQSPGRPRLSSKLLASSREAPLIAQIWGKNPDNFYKTAKEIADGTFARELGMGESFSYAGVDLNMGCPQKTEVNGGTCSALINNRPLAHEIIEATREGLAGKLPLSVKTRIGFSEIDMTWIDFLLSHNLNMLSVHGRTRKEMSKVPAHWECIGEARRLRDQLAPNTLIVGNGDVSSRREGEQLAEKYELDGIMVGRGIFSDPFLFSKQSPWLDYSPSQKIELYMRHVKLFAETWQNKQKPVYVLNKFCKLYINGFNGAKDFREKLMNCESIETLISELNKYELVPELVK
jgi:tRNA-dihydrouridine synthase